MQQAALSVQHTRRWRSLENLNPGWVGATSGVVVVLVSFLGWPLVGVVLAGGLLTAYALLARERSTPESPAEATLTPGGVERVYRSLARFVHCDGKVEGHERETLEVLRKHYGIRSDTAERLEREGIAEWRTQLGSNPTEHTLLLDLLHALVDHEPRVSARKRRFLRRILADLDLPRQSMGLFVPVSLHRASSALS